MNATLDYSDKRWGHNVSVLRVEDGGQWLHVAGWGAIPEAEDYLILSNEGKTTRYQVVAVERCFDPPDMWFADLTFAPRLAGA